MKVNIIVQNLRNLLRQKKEVRLQVRLIVVGVIFICVMGVVTNICPENLADT